LAFSDSLVEIEKHLALFVSLSHKNLYRRPVAGRVLVEKPPPLGACEKLSPKFTKVNGRVFTR
jgi:hypothetical protein